MITLEQLNARSQGYLPGLIGVELLSAEPGRLTSRLPLRPELLAPNGYLHAATVIALADTACGYGTFADLPSGANNFTTIELKSNFLGSNHTHLRFSASRA
jgi:acyl-coenzyme A thioesterase PaaI-like protein